MSPARRTSPARRATTFTLVRGAMLARGIATMLEQLGVVAHFGSTADDYQCNVNESGIGPDVLIVDAELAREFVDSLDERSKPMRVVAIGKGDAPLELSQWVPESTCAWLATDANEATLELTLHVAVSCLNGSPNFDTEACRRCAIAESLSPTTLPISKREREIFFCLARGIGANQIAAELGISVKTVESHRTRIRRKLGVGSVAEMRAAAIAWRFGLLNISTAAYQVVNATPPKRSRTADIHRR